LGTQYQITFSDINETKGFHVLDTETREIKFVPNPHKMFVELRYDDTAGPMNLEEVDFTELRGCYVRVVVDNKTHPYTFDRFTDKLYDGGVAKLTIIEELNETESVDDELVDLAQDTVTLINNEIDIMDEVKDKDKMKRLVKDLYMESLSL
jgi:hypothetical protein